jgi:hypothetical protein
LPAVGKVLASSAFERLRREFGRQLVTDLSTKDAEALLARNEKLSPDVRLYLPAAVRACASIAADGSTPASVEAWPVMTRSQ